MRRLLSVLFLLSGFAMTYPSLCHAQDKGVEDLKKEAQALNNFRSEEAISKKIKELEEDRKHLRALVRAAYPIAQKEDHPYNYSAAHILGYSALITRENSAAIAFLKIAIDKASKVKSERKLMTNRRLLTRAYLADQKPVEAEKVAEKLFNTRPNAEDEDSTANAIYAKLYGGNELVRCAMAQGKFDEAKKHLDFLEKTFLSRGDADGSTKGLKALIYETKAQFFQYKGDLKEAIKIYEELIEDAEKDEYKEGYREYIGNIYGDLGEVEKSESILGELLKKKPDNPGLNNDLGYILAVHDRKLDDAERMIKKAVDQEPENSSFLDSMAWVLYKKKKFKEAKEYMLRAVAQERGKNTELMEHLGDIHLALGEKSEGKAAYEKALAAATPSYKDQQRKPEIEKKIKKVSE